GKNIIRWLLKKRTNGSVRYCQYTSSLAGYQSSKFWAASVSLYLVKKSLTDKSFGWRTGII
ncbi:hypothetical protein ACI50N_23790, partial [Escherichia coli]|uniref:hypothetical protein n=1 Tax=Escherichia coli TaxID=562 RepID=UPI0038CBF7C4